MKMDKNFTIFIKEWYFSFQTNQNFFMTILILLTNDIFYPQGQAIFKEEYLNFYEKNFRDGTIQIFSLF